MAGMPGNSSAEDVQRQLPLSLNGDLHRDEEMAIQALFFGIFGTLVIFAPPLRGMPSAFSSRLAFPLIGLPLQMRGVPNISPPWRRGAPVALHSASSTFCTGAISRTFFRVSA
jgi:hypothetical protein